jgi:pantoate--beta-alanine ligase
MQKLQTIEEARTHLDPLRRRGQQIGLVPTMGAIHEGHRSLIRAARQECDHVVVSIFVNPTQFGPQEDFQSYPRPLADDLAACEQEGADAAFCPQVEEMYPPNAVTTVTVDKLTSGLCGQHRPGHFAGVTTIVAKLFNIIQPNRAYFGQKDAQQAAVIRQMTRDLDWPIEIVVCPTVRESDGLAMSSRNAYLSPAERKQATCLIEALRDARDQILAGSDDAPQLRQRMRKQIESAGPAEIDYIEIVDPVSLEPLQPVRRPCLLALAVHIGPARLIDNLLVDAHSTAD